MTTLTTGALACALLCTTALLAPAHAALQPPPVHPNIDENGVDLTDGTFGFSMSEASIGLGEGELALVRSWSRGGWREAWSGNLYQRLEGADTVQHIVFGNRSVKFKKSGSTYIPASADGSTLSLSGSIFTYRASDGTTYEFRDHAPGMGIGYPCTDYDADRCFLLNKVKQPDGRTLTLSWHTVLRCVDISCGSSKLSARLTSVESSDGYKIAFAYALNSFSGIAPPVAWAQRTSATLSNKASCTPGSGGCSASAWPVVTYSGTTGTTSVAEITIPNQDKWGFTYSASGLTGIRRPGSSANNISVNYVTGGIVSAVTRDGVTTSYAYSISGNTATMVVTDAMSKQRVIVSDRTLGRPLSVTDELARVTTYQYDVSGRLTRVTAPEGNYSEIAYDARGNVTSVLKVPKAGSGASNILTSAAFDNACGNLLTCNQPNSTTDARGNVTEYSYDPNHGGLATVTAPAPTPGAVRPQTRFTYTAREAVFLNSSGAAVASGAPTYVLSAVSECQTSASCAGAADEARTVLDYGAATSPNNLLPQSVSAGSGDGSLTATQAFVYDSIGNVVTIDGPLPGTSDVSRVRYDAARRVVATVSPDPDGAGALKHRVTRTVYNPAGQPGRTEAGTATGQSDAHIDAALVLEASETDYDSAGRPIAERVIGNGAVQTVTQQSYDVLGRPKCTSVRMDPASFGSLPGACTQTAAGSDLISETVHNGASELVEVRSAVGTALESADRLATYTPNGQLLTVTDGEGNKTTYEYDGHDRPVKTFFPSPTQGAGTSSAADYEQLTYDAASNVTSRRLRDGNSIGYGYDALDRMTSKTRPNSEGNAAYGYDNLGRMTSNVDMGKTINFTWDALGRPLTEVNRWGTTRSTWDVAGRRTRLQHPDGFYVDYDHLVTGETWKVRENGATSGIGVLATYAYDDLGRRASLTRGNGTVRSYGYDSVSRTASLGEDLAGTAGDLALDFTYDHASRIASTTRSNDGYAWTGHYNLNRGYASNGLNQYTASGSVTPTYDARGNLTSAGATAYSYTSDNLLFAKSGVDIANYDGLMRLSRVGSTGQPATKFNYDGTALIGEYDGTVATISLQRRYVHGPGADEPLVWYEGSGTSDRRFLHSDERGSVVAVSDSAGNSTAINRYDEYGIPAATNAGRFQYTGQTWLPELGMYHYKARIYSPTLGRFLQTDPIGYGDGMNLYAYVGNDPVNFVDPTGLSHCAKKGEVGVVCGGKWDKPASAYPSLPRRQVAQVQPPSAGRRVHRPTAARARGGQLPCQTKSLGVELAETALDGLGLLGDGAQVLGAYTGFAPLAVAGTAAEYLSIGGSAALHWGIGDKAGLAEDAISAGAGLVPGGRIARRVGGAAADWGRRSNGTLASGWNRKQGAQDATFSSGQSNLASAASFCPKKSR